MDQQDIELQLWEYIDGVCDEAGKKYIEQMITTDKEWKSFYERLIALHMSIPVTDLEQPSLRFTKNIMEAVEHIAIARATHKYINPVIIRVISGFFICSMIAFLVYALMAATGTEKKLPLPGFEWNRLYNSSFFNILTCVNVLIALLFIDALLRRKKMRQSEERLV